MRGRLLLGLLPLALLAAEHRDVEFARPGGVPLTLDVWTPEAGGPQRPAVILVHGGGWEAGDKRTYIRPWFDVFTGAGIPWFTINYRLAPAYRHPAAAEDIESAVRWVRANAARFNVDANQLVLVGESAGGHLVSLVAIRKKVKLAGVVSFYGIHDIPLWVEQRGSLPRNIAQYLGATKPEAASPALAVARRTPPHLLIHGTADKGVPYQQSIRMCDAMKRAGARCEVELIEGAPHGVEAWEKSPAFQSYKQTMVRWLQELWKQRGR